MPRPDTDAMLNPLRILVLGASYGSLLATKCAAAGHSVDLVCLPPEADAINRFGVIARIPSRQHNRVFEVHSKALRGQISAGAAGSFAPRDYALVGLAMQEPQYRAADVRALLRAVADARVPCLSIMNMPPLPYLRRIASVDVAALRACYTEPAVWDGFDPALMTLCSPDAQTLRPDATRPHVIDVPLATNFKAAPFESPIHTTMLRRLERDIDAALFADGDRRVDLPVKLRISDSLFVPLSKWCMLLSGNYRCIRPDRIRSIKEAVHDEIDASQAVYEWVATVCRKLGARESDLVPFVKYANAALSLGSPSSAARALANGVCHIERADRLVQTIARQLGMRSEIVDDTVALVDRWLERNRMRRAEPRTD